MTLQSYLDQEKLSYAAFGRRCVPEIPRVSIRQYALGQRFPQAKEIFEVIERASCGAVTANDFVKADVAAAE